MHGNQTISHSWEVLAQGCLVVSRLSTPQVARLDMVVRRKTSVKRDDLDDDLARKAMFAEYREENGKDLEREGCGEW